MAQPEPFPHTTPPVESTPPTLYTEARTRLLCGEPSLPEVPLGLSNAAARFEVLRFHARGGMGEVSVALDRELQREVAFKQIQPAFAGNAESRRRFILEAEVTGRLEHPGIVPIYGLGVQGDGRPYYAMRFIQGDSLRDAIQAFHAADTTGRTDGARELALRGLLRRFVDVCNAVAYAHDRGWLHRDLKPANVMLGKFGETLVVDWGLARLLRTDDGTLRMAESGVPSAAHADATQETKQGVIVGTPPYMSPEQARGDWDAVGIRSDVYSLGAMLYELLTGSVPFAGSLSEVLEAVKAGQLVPVRQRKPGVSAALAAVVARALALRREERYASAQELAAEVERWLADEPVQAYREPLTQRLRRWGRRHRALVTGLAVLLLTTSVALTIGLVLVNQARAKATAAEQATAQALARVTEEEGKTRLALGAAMQQRQLALATTRKVVDKIHARLKNRPDLHELREELLEEARLGLDEVARAADTAQAIDHAQIWVHFELGDLYLSMEQRGLASALRQYQRGHAISRRLAEAEPEKAQAQRDLAMSLIKLGDVRLRLGDTQAALDAYQQCHEVLRRLAQADPRNAEAQRDLAVSLNKLGNVRLQLRDTPAVLDAYQQYHVLARRLAEAEPKNGEAQRDLAISLNKLGNVRLQLGETKAALDAYQQSHEVLRRLVEAEPKNVEAQRDLAVSHERLGNVRLQLRDTKAALDAYQQFHARARRLAEADPRNGAAQRDLSAALSTLGDVRLRLGETQAALDAYEQCHEVLRRLAKAEPQNAQAQRDLSVSHEKLGNVRLKRGDKQAALDAYQQSFDLRCRLVEADPKNAEAQRDLAVSHEKVGDVRLRLGETKAAQDAYQRSFDVRQRLAEADPQNAQAQRDLMIGYYKLGKLHEAQQEFGSAATWFEMGLVHLRRWPEPTLFQRPIQDFEGWLRLCRAADMALTDPASAQSLPTALRLQVLSAILRPLAKQKQRDKLLIVGELLAKEERNPDALYVAACAVALCVPLTDKADDKEKHAVRAVALLQQAIAAGYKERAHIEKDTDLDPLRQRADFQKVLQSLPATAPPP